MNWISRQRGSSAAVRGCAVRTPGEFLRLLGRGVLWCVVALLLLRGAASVMAGGEVSSPVREQRTSAVPWPDDEARAFAADFARAYLTYSPRRPDAYRRAMAAFVAPEVGQAAVARFGRRQTVLTATVARSSVVDSGHALVTVATTVAAKPSTLGAPETTTRYLTVPVGRDGHGGLVVYDLPSFSPPPSRAAASGHVGESLPAADAAAVEQVLRRFFRGFLAGRASDLEYLAPTGTRIVALGQRYRLLELGQVVQVGGQGREPTVLADVRARDEETSAVYALRYRVRLVRRDRWYVAAVNQTSTKE